MKTAEEYNALIIKAPEVLVSMQDDSHPSNNVLFDIEMNERTPFARHLKLQRFITDYPWKFGLELSDTFQPWLIPRIAYELQQKRGIDFGYCEHFRPDFEKQMRENISGQYTLESLPKCDVGEEAMTTCDGLARAQCIFLRAEKEKN